MLKTLPVACVLIILSYANAAKAEVLTWQLGKPLTFTGAVRYSPKAIEAISLRALVSQEKQLQAITFKPYLAGQTEVVFVGPGTRTLHQFGFGLTGSMPLPALEVKLGFSAETAFAVNKLTKPKQWPLRFGLKLSHDLRPGTVTLQGNLQRENKKPGFVVRIGLKFPTN